MIFNSIAYLIFLPVTLAVLTLVPKQARWLVLLLASWGFYMAWNPKLITLILFSTLVSWLCSLGIGKTVSRGMKRLYLALSLVTLLGLLFFFKYFDFFAETSASLLGLFGISSAAPRLNLVLPVGISFYTFQTLSYVIDVYRGKFEAEKHFGYYALFVSFFPQLVAGPIERPENLLPQLRAGVGFSRENTRAGLVRMTLGYFKKVAVADMLASCVERVYSAPAEQTALSVFLATALFAVQIYCDFSGYSDIAVGTARLMGIRLSENFRRPYFAVGIREFWERWHISLSGWLRDYLYIALGGNRKGKARTQFNILIVFLASGLWHGANLTFVVWGLLHGIARVFENLCDPLLKRADSALEKKRSLRCLWRGARHVLTCLFVGFAWIFFRADRVSTAFGMIGTLFTDRLFRAGALSEALALMGTDGFGLLLLAALASVLLLHDAGEEKEGVSPIGGGLETVLVCFWIIVVAAIVQAASGGASTFIYFQF